MSCERIRFLASVLVWFSWSAPLVAQSQGRVNPSQSASTNQNAEKSGLSADQARMMVKEIPGVDVQSTLARWKFQEPELVKLRGWSGSLAQDPGRTDFLPQWSELVTQRKAQNPQLRGSDITSLIQMVMLASYKQANQDLDSYAQRVKFYTEMKDRVSGQLTEAQQMQALLRSHRNDPLSGSLIRLPAHQRTLQKCQVQSAPLLKLDCKEIRISTTPELESYLADSEDQIKKAEGEAQQAKIQLQSLQQRRQEVLQTLSNVGKMMYDMTVVRKAGGGVAKPVAASKPENKRGRRGLGLE